MLFCIRIFHFTTSRNHCLCIHKNFYFLFIFLKLWKIVNLQCCVSFRCTSKWLLSIYILFKFFSIIGYLVQFSRSLVSDSATPWTAAHQASLSITNSQSLLKFMSNESVMPSNHVILCWPLLLLPSIFPSIRVFSKSQLFASGGQNIGVSASTSVLPMNTQDWFPLGWTGWISLQFKGLSRVFSNTTVQKHQLFGA